MRGSNCVAAVQVESDIKPFKGLLMGLFFMSVGMDMQFSVFFANWISVMASLAALIVGKLAVMMAISRPVGVSTLSAIRSGLYLAPGGEFAFVVFGEAVQKGLLTSTEVAPIVFMVVLSMAITPYLGVRFKPAVVPPRAPPRHALATGSFPVDSIFHAQP
jgi:Kef-type K+ transport system membrane component KefB